MQMSVTEAKAQLTDLVRRAEAGDDVVLTRHGKPAVRLVPVKVARTPKERRAAIDKAVASARGKIIPGPCAARSQDFLYDEDGLPA